MIHQIDDTPYYAVVKAQICWKNVGVAFIRKWRLRHRPVSDCLEEAGDRLFTFTRLPRSQWRGARTTNAIKVCTKSSSAENADRIAIGRYCGDVVLGAARLWSDQHA